MAVAGLQQWARAALVQVDRIEAARQAMWRDIEQRVHSQSQFQCDRHFFLIAAHKMVEHAKWCIKLDFLDRSFFDNVLLLEKDIKPMRDLNEHALEYFQGRGLKPSEWVHVDAGGTADASSTINSKIGNRLDWNDVASAVKQLLEVIPAAYYPGGRIEPPRPYS